MSERCEDVRGPVSEVTMTESSDRSHVDLACATSDRAIEIKTYRVTISVKGDISDGLVRWVLRTYDKENKYVVCERGQNGQRHLHMLIQFEKPKEKRHLRTAMFRAVKQHHKDSNGKALVINAAYDMKWFDEYLRKEYEVEHVDTDDFDAESFRNALPDKATQTALQAATRCKPIGAYWIDHEKRWIERFPYDTTYESAIRYFKERMFVLRDMEPISDPVKLRKNAYTLYAYRNKSIEPDFGDNAYMKKEYDGEIIFKTMPM
jgi:hypothetical protein